VTWCRLVYRKTFTAARFPQGWSWLKGEGMALLSIGAKFPEVKLEDIDGNSVAFPASFGSAPASIVFFYRGQW
jgi:hypothetical protein